LVNKYIRDGEANDRFTNTGLVHLRTTYRAAVFEAAGVCSADEVQSPKLLRLLVLPVDETFRSLLYRCPCNVNISIRY